MTWTRTDSAAGQVADWPRPRPEGACCSRSLPPPTGGDTARTGGPPQPQDSSTPEVLTCPRPPPWHGGLEAVVGLMCAYCSFHEMQVQGDD